MSGGWGHDNKKGRIMSVTTPSERLLNSIRHNMTVYAAKLVKTGQYTATQAFEEMAEMANELAEPHRKMQELIDGAIVKTTSEIQQEIDDAGVEKFFETMGREMPEEMSKVAALKDDADTPSEAFSETVAKAIELAQGDKNDTSKKSPLSLDDIRPVVLSDETKKAISRLGAVANRVGESLSNAKLHHPRGPFDVSPNSAIPIAVSLFVDEESAGEAGGYHLELVRTNFHYGPVYVMTTKTWIENSAGELTGIKSVEVLTDLR